MGIAVQGLPDLGGKKEGKRVPENEKRSGPQT